MTSQVFATQISKQRAYRGRHTFISLFNRQNILPERRRRRALLWRWDNIAPFFWTRDPRERTPSWLKPVWFKEMECSREKFFSSFCTQQSIRIYIANSISEWGQLKYEMLGSTKNVFRWIRSRNFSWTKFIFSLSSIEFRPCFLTTVNVCTFHINIILGGAN